MTIIPDPKLNKALEEQYQGSIEAIENLFNSFPENLPLYKDSGLWQLRSDHMDQVILRQQINESFIEFVVRVNIYFDLINRIIS